MKPPLRDCWDEIANFRNLANAHRLAKRGKGMRPEVARFHARWEWEVLRLEQELKTLQWTPSPFRQFTIYEGKARVISATPYRDRVVHQAVMNLLAPRLESHLIHDCYACRVGKGTEAARTRAQHYLRGRRYFLHLDVVKFFPSIPHTPLKKLLRRFVADEQLELILHRIIDHDGMPPSDDLVELAERRGLPIGSLTSQWFANLYLSPLDHFIKEELRVPGFVRYMDDFVLFGDDKSQLWEWERQIRQYADEHLRLRLHDYPRLAPSAEGLSFLGMRLFPTYRRMLPPSGYRFCRRMRGALRALMAGRTTPDRLQAQQAGWLGHARLANTVALCASIHSSLFGQCPEGRTA